MATATKLRNPRQATRMGGSRNLKEPPSVAGRPRQSQPPHVKGTPAGAFGERLAELMATANVTAKDLAEALGKSEDSIWGYMRGTAVPHINDWPKIARKLKLKDARDLLPKLPAK